MSKLIYTDREEKLYKKILSALSWPLETCGRTHSNIDYIKNRNADFVICIGRLFDQPNYQPFYFSGSCILQLPELSYMLIHSSSIQKSIQCIKKLGEKNEPEKRNGT